MCDFVRMFIPLHPEDERKVKILQFVMLMIRYGLVFCCRLMVISTLFNHYFDNVFGSLNGWCFM